MHVEHVQLGEQRLLDQRTERAHDDDDVGRGSPTAPCVLIALAAGSARGGYQGTRAGIVHALRLRELQAQSTRLLGDGGRG